jgi:uncharacterized membrane protein
MESSASTAWNVPVFAVAAGIAALGVLSQMSGDFAFQWQPVDAALPDRAQWAAAIGAAELLIALTLTIPGSRTLAATAAAALYGFWSLLHAPGIVEHPQSIGAWLGAAEPFGIAMGLLTFALSRANNEAPSALADLCVRAFGIACIIFGASHFAYPTFTAAMVPPFLPMPLVLAYVAGTIHAACGVALLLGFQRRIASLAEAAMMSSFVLLVHLPRVLATPSSRLEWTMLSVALVLSSAAWLIARNQQTQAA